MRWEMQLATYCSQIFTIWKCFHMTITDYQVTVVLKRCTWYPLRSWSQKFDPWMYEELILLKVCGLLPSPSDFCVPKFGCTLRTLVRVCLVVYDGCPRSFAHIWWPRTQFGSEALEPCPLGSQGRAARLCDSVSGTWLSPDIFNCTSDAFMDLRKLVSSLVTGIGLIC